MTAPPHGSYESGIKSKAQNDSLVASNSSSPYETQDAVLNVCPNRTVRFYTQFKKRTRKFLIGGGCLKSMEQRIFFCSGQVASRELNIPQSYIHLSETSTVTVPNSSFTAASMGTDINGKAVQVTFPSVLSHPVTVREETSSCPSFYGR